MKQKIIGFVVLGFIGLLVLFNYAALVADLGVLVLVVAIIYATNKFLH